MSTVKCANIQNASSATTNITLDTSGNATVGGTLSMTGGGSFLRNRLINGGFRVDQRNAGASQTITAAAALAYTVDRWYAYCTGANVTGQQVSNSGTTASPAQNAYQFTGAASVTAIGFGQRIEAVNCFDLAGTTATLSVNLSNSLLTTVTWTASYANTADTFGTLASPTVTQIATGTFTVNSTLTRYSTSISIPAAATTGIQIVFTVGAQTSGTWIIGNCQLESGGQTSFERRQYGQELALSQRYYQTFSYGITMWAGDGNGYGQRQPFPVPMRATPTSSSSLTSSVNQASGYPTIAGDSASSLLATLATSSAPAIMQAVWTVKMSVEL